MNEFIKSVSLNESDIIRSILESYFIVDYGYITKVNPDKTVNVTHSAKPVLQDGTELEETTTDNVEVLTISGQGFSLQWDYKAKDKVLLLGFKDYVAKVEEVEQAQAPKSFSHYSRSTMKAIPMCIFSDDAKVKIKIEDGNVTVEAEGDVTVKPKGKVSVETDGDVSLKAKGDVKVENDGKIEIKAKKDISIKTDADVTITATNVKAQCTKFTVADKLTGAMTALEVTP